MKQWMLDLIGGSVALAVLLGVLWFVIWHQKRYQQKKFERYAEEVLIEHKASMEQATAILKNMQERS